jgi:hypothetical protein
MMLLDGRFGDGDVVSVDVDEAAGQLTFEPLRRGRPRLRRVPKPWGDGRLAAAGRPRNRRRLDTRTRRADLHAVGPPASLQRKTHAVQRCPLSRPHCSESWSSCRRAPAPAPRPATPTAIDSAPALAPAMTIERFLRAVNQNDLDTMASLFGTREGPVTRTWSRQEVRRPHVPAGIAAPAHRLRHRR